jgi:hypothetical protein
MVCLYARFVRLSRLRLGSSWAGSGHNSGTARMANNFKLQGPLDVGRSVV